MVYGRVPSWFLANVLPGHLGGENAAGISGSLRDRCFRSVETISSRARPVHPGALPVQRRYSSRGDPVKHQHWCTSRSAHLWLHGGGGWLGSCPVVSGEEVSDFSFGGDSPALVSSVVSAVAPRLSRLFQRTGRRSEERRVGKECRSRWSPYP